MSVCFRCGAPFSCAMLGEMEGPCWCTELPRMMPLPGLEAASCYCPGCLKIALAEQTDPKPPPPHD
jgi:hypothetical protein